jgi:RNA polymerase sigma-70 factor (ECF subfamily)
MTDALDQIYERMLIARCQAGDAEAFAEIVRSYQARLHYFLRKIVGSDGRVDDLLQDVWLDAFRSLAMLKEPAAFPAWIYRVTRDRAYRELRGQRREESIQEDFEVAIVEDDHGQAFSKDEVQLVHECLDELTPAHREVLVLRFLEGMNYESIAGVVGCGVGTVRSRLHYGKQALRAAIERKQRQ